MIHFNLTWIVNIWVEKVLYYLNIFETVYLNYLNPFFFYCCCYCCFCSLFLFPVLFCIIFNHKNLKEDICRIFVLLFVVVVVILLINSEFDPVYFLISFYFFIIPIIYVMIILGRLDVFRTQHELKAIFRDSILRLSKQI